MEAGPAPQPHLRVVGCPDCERKQRALDAALLDMGNLETDLTVKRRQVSALKRELSDKYHSDPLFEKAEDIFGFWRKHCCPNARTFSEDRVKAVLGRLKDKDPETGAPAYSPHYIGEAILGAKYDPFVKDGKAFRELELICRTGSKLESFHARYERWRAA